MTSEQLYLSIGVPAAINAILFALVLAYVNTKFDGVRNELREVRDSLRNEMRELKETLRAEMREMRAEIRLEIKESADRRVIGGR